VSAHETYSLEDRRRLLQLAREALILAVNEHRQLSPLPELPPQLLEKAGCFVTLTLAGQLRGCIGNIFPDGPLAAAVASNAYRAALNDSRFAPVRSDELSRIDVEISVLSLPQPLHYDSTEDLLRKLRPKIDGVVLRRGAHRSTFLPQVWDKLPAAVEFLDQLAAKAGLPRDAWRQPDTEISIYHVEAFDEAELRHSSAGNAP
jgi:AmmeMemoRadiSam system protein A